MQDSAGNRYQQGELLTATPQKLQYLLIDGAVRFAKKASQHWQCGDFEQGGEAMDRCEAILAEILKNIRTGDGAVADQIASLYLFLLTSATQAHFGHDAQQLDKVISILETERETWRVLCETTINAKMSNLVESNAENRYRQDRPGQTTGVPIAPPLDTHSGQSSFSLEA